MKDSLGDRARLHHIYNAILEIESYVKGSSYKELMGEFNIGLGLYQPIANKFLLQIIPKYSYSVYDDRSPGSRELHSVKMDMEFYFRLN